MIMKEVADNGLIADLFTDTTVQSRKAIIMLGGSEGGKVWSSIRIRRPIELLVQQGYSVLSLAYFKAQGLPYSLEEIPLEYFEKAFNWLSAQKGIVANEYVVLGGSKGAEAALLLASKYSQVKAVIAFSPSCVVWQGIPEKRFEIGKDVKSSWSYKGESLPFLAYPPSVKKMDLLLLRLRKMHEEALQNTAGTSNAEIKVENIQGPILLISGERDRLWPATNMSKMIMNRLKTNMFDYKYEHIVYQTGHNGIIINRDCWRKIFTFLKAYYASSEG
jgi:pimeloyl-ACP methyl ester carboxylesterase